MWARKAFYNFLLTLLALSFLKASALACRDEEKPAKSKENAHAAQPEGQQPSIKKEDFRFDGKDFHHWRTYLLAELKTERRIKALEAIKAFAENGYGKEAAKTILDMARTHKGALTDMDRDVFTKALLVFRDIGQAHEPLLVDALGDANKHVRSFAVGILACHVKSVSRTAVPGLIRATVERGDDQWFAVPALAKIDDIGTLLKNELQDEKKAKKFFEALTEIIEKEAIANVALLSTMDSDKKEIARAFLVAPGQAARLLGEMDPSARDAIPSLLKSLKRPFSFSFVCIFSAEALGKIGAEPDQVIPALVEALKNHNDILGESVDCSLGRFGPRAKSAAPALRETLTNKNLRVCLAAFLALDEIGEDAGKTVPVVLETMEKAGQAARLKIYESLQTPQQAFVPLLLRAFEQFPDDRPEIASTLGHFGPVAREAIGLLTRALDDKNPKVQRAAADALQKNRVKEK